MSRIPIVLLAGALAAMTGRSVVAQTAAPATVALEAANQKASLEGDLPGAIKLYQAVIDQFANTDRAIAATALLKIAECHQKLGDAQAVIIYQRIVRDYGGSPEAAAATKWLAAASGQTVASGPFKVRLPDTRLGVESVPSPDGTRAIEVDLANQRIIVRDLATGRSQVPFALGVDPAGTPDGVGVRWSRDGRRLWGKPIWSPDGQRVAFTVLLKTNEESPVASAHAELDVASLAASVVRTIVGPTATRMTPLAWTTNDEIFYSSTPQPMSSSTRTFNFVSATGGESRRVLSTLNQVSAGRDTARFEDLTPDGKSALVIRSDHLAIIDLATNDERALTLATGVMFPRISPDGILVAFAARQTGTWALYVAPLDRLPIRNPIQVASLDVGDPSKVFAPHIRWTKDGVLTCDYEANENNIYRIDVDVTTARVVGTPERLTHDVWAGAGGGVSVSPDSRHIAFTPPLGGVVLMDSDGGHLRRLTADSAPRRITTSVRGWRSSGEILFAQRDADAASVRSINITTAAVTPIAFSIDPFAARWWQYMTAGNEVWYTSNTDRESVVARSLVNGSERVVLKLANVAGWLGSQDGQQIAYTVLPSGRAAEIHVIQKDGSGDRVLTTMPWGTAVTDPRPDLIAWAPDGRHLLYRVESGGMAQVLEIKTGQSWVLLDSAPGRTFLRPDVGIEWFGGAWSPDGSFVTFILNTSQIRRLAFEGVTYDAVSKIAAERRSPASTDVVSVSERIRPQFRRT